MRKGILLFLLALPFWAHAQNTVTNSAFSNGFGTGNDGTITVVTALGSSGSLLEVPSPPTVATADSLALVSLYWLAGGASWTNKTNWLTGPVNTWFGVTVSGNRVTELSLPSNNLVNTLPNLSPLAALKRLDIRSNNFSPQSIPNTLNTLIAMEYLDLSNNRFNGTITNLSELVHLKFFSLTNNTSLSPQELPRFLFSLDSLQTLRLRNCQLVNFVPNGLSRLSQLKELDLSFNSLLRNQPGVTLEEIATLSKLEVLDLRSSGFNGSIPSSLVALPMLTSLQIIGADFDGLPPASAWVSFRPALLDISNNRFDFGDLEPLTGLTNPLLINTGQKLFFPFTQSVSSNIKLLEGDTFVLTPTAGVAGSNNLYQWYLNNVAIGGGNNLTLNLNTLDLNESGVYRLDVTNTLVTGVTLSSVNITLTIVPRVESLFASTTGIISSDVQTNSSGGYWADIDKDGDEDLLVGNYFSDVPNFLYENLGDGTFSKLATGEIATLPDGARYASWGDYNNDGYPDVFLGEYSNAIGSPSNDNTSSLYRNNGNKTFTRIPVPFKSEGGLWADYDNDGDLDLFMNGSNASPATNKIYKNNGDGTFELVDNWIPVTGTWYAGWIDIDNDGDLDYNITPGTFSNQIKVFRNSNGVFGEENLPVPTGTFSHRGSSWGDIDGDGDLDLFAMNSAAGTANIAQSQFFINDGSGNFTMVAASSKMGVQGWGGRGSSFADADNDGDLDLFIIHRPSLASPDIVPQLFLNDGLGNFTGVPQTTQSFGFNDGFTGLSLADYNNDGWMDLFIASFDPLRPNYLFQNRQSGNNWLKLRLVGMQSNKTAIGARVDFFVGNQRFTRQIMPSSGLQSQNSYIVHSGLGTASKADSVVIHWPSGVVQRLNNAAANQQLTVIESGLAEPPTIPASDIAFSNVLATSAQVSFTIGNGTNRMAVIKLGSAPTFIPADDNFYSGDLGNGEHVVFNGPDSTFTLSELLPDTEYFLTIFEYNTDSTVTRYLTSGAPVASFRTLPLPNVYVITPADSAMNQPVTLNVTARALTGATTYTIELSDAPDFTGNSFVKSGTRTQNFTGLSYATTYYTRVRTNLSPAYGITTAFSTLVPNIFVSAPANGAVNVATTVNLTAVALAGATQYTIELNERPDFTGAGIMQTGARTQSFTGLKNNQQYYTRVKTDVYPVFGAVTTFTTAIPNVFVTTPANDAVNQNSTLSVTARTLTGASEYTIELNEAADFSAAGFVQSGARTQTFTGLKYNTQYFTRVRTNLSPVYGQVTSFTTADAAFFAYVTSPANGSVDRNANLSITSNTVSGASQYTIQLSESPDFAMIDFQVTGSNRTLTFNGLKYSTTYYNRVGSDKSSQFGEVRSFTTRSAEGLAYVTSPANGAVGQNTTLNVTANAVPNATEYTIQLSESNGFSEIAFEQTGPTRTLSFSGLKYNTTYYNRVITNAEVTFDFGPIRSFTTRTAESITFVTSPANGATNVNNASVNVVANTVPGATAYTIQLSESPDFTDIAFEQTGSTRILNFTELKYNTTYYNRVRTDLSTEFGAVRNFTTRTAESISYVVSPGNAASGVSYNASVRANTVPGATVYTIELNTAADFSGTAFVQSSGSTTMLFNGLAYNTTYYNRVKTDLSPNWGSVRSFTTASPASLSYLTSPANNSTNVNWVVSLTANNVPNATYYTIEANTLVDFTGTSIVKAGARTQSFTLAQNQTYYVRVRTELQPEWGPTRQFTTGDVLSRAFITSPLNGSTGVPTTVNVTANSIPGATSYTIQLSADSLFTAPITRTGTSRTQSFAALSESTRYFARVSTSLTPGLFGPLRSFTTVNPLARDAGASWEADSAESEAIDEDLIVRVYPSPFTSVLHVHVQTAEQIPLRVSLSDMSGKKLFQSQDWQTNRPYEYVSQDAAGVYLLLIETGGKREVLKVIKQ